MHNSIIGFNFITNLLNNLFINDDKNKLTKTNLDKINNKNDKNNKNKNIVKYASSISELVSILLEKEETNQNLHDYLLQINPLIKKSNYKNKNNCSFDDIDDLLVCARLLFEREYMEEYELFIYLCPNKFLEAYANNSETTPRIISYLSKTNRGLKTYIYSFTDVSKKLTWHERYPDAGIF
jgi:hypothetical protein